MSLQTNRPDIKEFLADRPNLRK